MIQDTKRIYRVGTLSYTRAGLVTLFMWLLWGDFCYTMMLNVTPALIPLILRRHEASNFFIGILMGSIPALLNFIINPIVSTASDRTRTRWGRRRPYLMFSPPFVFICLLMLGWSEQIGTFFYRICWGENGNPAFFVIVWIAIFTVAYQAFDLFVASIYCYIFADVVPSEFIGRFMAMFRMAGALGGLFFNLVVLPLADVHMPVIFTVIGLIYLISFTGMCLKVKEGDYPQPAPVKPGVLPMFKKYFNECFTIPFFIILFIGLGMNYASTICRAMFNLLFAREMLGISLTDYGRVMATCAIIAIILYIPIGILADKYHPLRIYMIGAVLVIFANIFGFFFVKDMNSFFTVSILLAIVYVLQEGTMLPICIKLYPKEQFGQFCSAAAMIKAIMMVAASAGGGLFIDLLGYQYIYVWDFIFTIFCFGLIFWSYRIWKQLGGDQNYVPPTLLCQEEGDCSTLPKVADETHCI